MNILYKITLTLAIIGCLNWGLVSLLDFNLVAYLFGDKTIITKIIYLLVAISGLTNIGLLFKDYD